MTPERGRPTAPHLPVEPATPDLPERLSPLVEVPDDLRAAEVSERHLEALDLSGRDASSWRISESRLDDVDLSSAVLRRALFRDVVVRGGSWANADLAEATLSRVEVVGARLTGVALTRASIRDATFTDCRIDLSSLRSARLERVRFDDCRIEEADLGGASFSSGAFVRCDLTGASLAKATFVRSEMRGCTLDRVGDAQQLRGVAMPWSDVVRAAASLASAVGIRILDDDA